MGIGGHVEKNENPLEAAVREVREETGIDIELFRNKKDIIKTQFITELVQPFTMLEERISARPNEPAHYHIDCIYFAIVNSLQKINMQEEFRWFSLEELGKTELEKEVRHNSENAINTCQQFLQ